MVYITGDSGSDKSTLLRELRKGRPMGKEGFRGEGLKNLYA
ncbi:hypothetical protein N752_17270 [Desulforamulus aquiferis]|nr:hypothetical protein N752_17270 [Desulforamulus aquiferis]